MITLNIWRKQVLIVFSSAIFFPFGIIILTKLRYIKFVEATAIFLCLFTILLLIFNKGQYFDALIIVNFMSSVFLLGFLSPENAKYDSRIFRKIYIIVLRAVALSVFILLCGLVAYQIYLTKTVISLGIGKFVSVGIDISQSRILIALLVFWILLVSYIYIRRGFFTIEDVIKEPLGKSSAHSGSA